MVKTKPRNPVVNPAKLQELRQRKERAGISFGRLAYLTGNYYSPGMISAILRGECGCHVDMLNKIESAIAKGEKVKEFAEKIGV